MKAFDPTTALVIVDVQNDFADPAGSLPVPGAQRVIDAVNDLAEAASAAGSLVVYTQDWHPSHTPHFVPDGGIWPVHCVGGSWGSDLHPGLLVRGPAVRKGSNGEDGYSGFTMRDPESGATHPTELDGLLRSHGVRRVVVAGLATDYCVQATALDAVRLGFTTDVAVDAIAAVNLAPGDGERALDAMRRAGATLVDGTASVVGRPRPGGDR